MKLPFTIDEFFEVFLRYNHGVWPAQIALMLVALVAVAMLLWPRRHSGAVISVVLASLWAWLGAMYHVLFFARINPAAYAFAIACIVAALVFLWKKAASTTIFTIGVLQRPARGEASMGGEPLPTSYFGRFVVWAGGSRWARRVGFLR